jgi:hypothetical protein
MARPLRINFENAVYHIITRGNRKEKIFYSVEDKCIFQKKMHKKVLKVKSWIISFSMNVLLNSSINFLSVSYVINNYNTLLFIYKIDNSMITDSDSENFI